MKFTVIYEGPLKPQKKADRDHKHFIRQQFHEQLRNLWQLLPLSDLRGIAFEAQTPDLAATFEAA